MPLGFISKSCFIIVLILSYNREPLEVCKQGNNLVQFLVLKDCLGTWRFSLMVEYLPGTSEALCPIPKITKTMERLLWMPWVMKYGKDGVHTEQSGCWPSQLAQPSPDSAPHFPQASKLLPQTPLITHSIYYTIKLNFVFEYFYVTIRVNIFGISSVLWLPIMSSIN